MTLGEYTRQYRAEHGLSQRELAKRCGLSPGYLAQLELNKRGKAGAPINPSLAACNAVASGTGRPLDELVRLLDMDTVLTVQEPIDAVDAIKAAMLPETLALWVEYGQRLLAIQQTEKSQLPTA